MMKVPSKIQSLSEDELQDLGNFSKDWAFTHGITMRTADKPDSADIAIHTPFLMFPSPTPKEKFEQIISIQQDFNLLMHRVAHDHEFLSSCLSSVIKVDAFTKQLWKIYETVRKEGVTQPLTLGLFRNDYMLDTIQTDESSPQEPVGYKQIEFNTISSSMAGFATQITKYHRFVMGNYLQACPQEDLLKRMPENEAFDGLARGLVKAWEAYGKTNAVVLFLHTELETNIYDQRFLEFSIRQQNPNIQCIRKQHQYVHDRGSLSHNKRLFVNGKEVAVVYLRSGYSPDSYTTKEEWEARLMIERSCAIKCPSLHYHLAGTKKVQQELCKPGIVEKFIPDKDISSRIRESFVGLFSLDKGEEGDKAIQLAMKDPEKYVLKPQREGGGNNIYGQDIVPILNKIKDTDERSAYILMEMVHPLQVQNCILRVGERVKMSTVVGELGVYGVILGSATQVLENYQSGHMLRTKYSGVNEGGISAGFGAIDSPYLI